MDPISGASVIFDVLGKVLSEDNRHKLAKAVRQWYKNRTNPIGRLSIDRLLAALWNAVGYLCADRWEDKKELGYGGWGQTDSAFVRYIYGPDRAAATNDSVMTTVNVVEALDAFAELLDRMGLAADQNAAVELRRWLYGTLGHYLERRWDAKTGEGGILAAGGHGDIERRPSYRHAAFLLRLWLVAPSYVGNCRKTCDYLIQNFERQNWRDAVVPTVVAARSALVLMEQSSSLRQLVDLRRVGNLITPASKY